MKTIQHSLRQFLKATFLLLSLGLASPDAASATNIIYPTTPSAYMPSPTHGPTGAVIDLIGVSFDKDKNGNAWTGSPPYQVRFKGAAGDTALNASFTFQSSGKLRVTVPAGALTGRISIVQGTYTQASHWSYTVDPPPAASFLKIQNNSQYNLISVKVNNVETLNPGNGVPVGTFMSLPRPAATYQVSVALGITTDAPLFFFNGSTTRHDWSDRHLHDATCDDQPAPDQLQRREGLEDGPPLRSGSLPAHHPLSQQRHLSDLGFRQPRRGRKRHLHPDQLA